MNYVSFPGDAFINNCKECVGGDTRRPIDFGADKCGLCRKARGYVETWDCFGTCNGTAEFDKCGECVGKLINEQRDA